MTDPRDMTPDRSGAPAKPTPRPVDRVGPACPVEQGRTRRAERAERRRRLRRTALVGSVAVIAALALGVAGFAALRGASAATADASVSQARSRTEATGAEPGWPLDALREATTVDPTPVFARYNELQLRLPVAADALTEIGFHQAAREYVFHMQTDLESADREACDDKVGTGEHTVSGTGEDATLEGACLTMWRSRPGKPDSAVDVGAEPGTPVYSPVDGEVLRVRHYNLYGKLADWEIHIRPDGHPKIDLVVIHVDDLQVQKGDRLEAGITQLATVRKISGVVDSQLADYTKNGGDHVHFQLNDVTHPEYEGLTRPDDPGLEPAPGE